MKLGYTPEQTSDVVSYIDKNGKIEGAPYLKPEHLPVFDCSLAPAGGGRSISWTGHVKMMAAAQPFLSGAISKTINMPEESTIDDISQAYILSWKMGLKAVAIYRDNSKRSQPLSAAGQKKDGKKPEVAAAPAATAMAGAVESLRMSEIPPTALPTAAVESGSSAVAAVQTLVAVERPAVAVVEPAQRELFPRTKREKMPVERDSVTHKFNVGGHEGYITVGKYPDGRVGEVFIKMSKEGSTLSGIMDGFALTMSLGLQYGVPLKVFVDKLLNTRFEPSGITANPNIRFVSSVLDYIARWLGGRFISVDYLKLNGGPAAESGAVAAPPASPKGVLSRPSPSQID